LTSPGVAVGAEDTVGADDSTGRLPGVGDVTLAPDYDRAAADRQEGLTLASVIAKIFLAKTFRAHSTNSLRHEKSLGDHGAGGVNGRLLRALLAVIGYEWRRANDHGRFAFVWRAFLPSRKKFP
jgi:hypothetical protein